MGRCWCRFVVEVQGGWNDVLVEMVDVDEIGGVVANVKKKKKKKGVLERRWNLGRYLYPPKSYPPPGYHFQSYPPSGFPPSSYPSS